MDMSTNYLGLKLKNPVVAAASPLSREVGSVRKLEDAGVAAVVMHSLFQEQIEHEDAAHDHFMEFGTESYAEALSYFPAQADYRRGRAPLCRDTPRGEADGETAGVSETYAVLQLPGKLRQAPR